MHRKSQSRPGNGRPLDSAGSAAARSNAPMSAAPEPDSQTANLLGALALAIADRQSRATEAAAGLGDSACAALVTLGPYPGMSIGTLAKILGLSHSVTVRIAGELVAAGLATRGEGEDRRAAALSLTPAGEARRIAILAARAKVQEDALAALPPGERTLLGRLAAAMLVALTDSPACADHLCRLCDEDACGNDDCPVGRRAEALAAGDAP